MSQPHWENAVPTLARDIDPKQLLRLYEKALKDDDIKAWLLEKAASQGLQIIPVVGGLLSQILYELPTAMLEEELRRQKQLEADRSNVEINRRLASLEALYASLIELRRDLSRPPALSHNLDNETVKAVARLPIRRNALRFQMPVPTGSKIDLLATARAALAALSPGEQNSVKAAISEELMLPIGIVFDSSAKNPSPHVFFRGQPKRLYLDLEERPSLKMFPSRFLSDGPDGNYRITLGGSLPYRPLSARIQSRVARSVGDQLLRVEIAIADSDNPSRVVWEMYVGDEHRD